MDSSLWLVACGVGALLVRVGLALYASGMMRAKNSASIMARYVMDFGLAVLAFWFLGAAIIGAKAGQWIAWPLIANISETSSPFLFFALCATLIATSIVMGTVGERSRIFPLSSLGILLAALVVPIVWRWVWTDGWLGRLGYRDLAGASIIHWVGALCALAAAILVGPRVGKYNRDGSANAIPGHSVSLASTGILLLLVGWFPYVLGFLDVDVISGAVPLGRIAMNILLAGASGAIASLLISQWKYLKPDIHLVYTGLFGALVSISAAADIGSGWVAVVLGAVAGLIIPTAGIMLDLVWRIDDPTGGIAIHGVGAAWGIIATGLLAPVGSFLDRLRFLGVQVLGLIAIAMLTIVFSAALLMLLKRTVGLRSREADEYDGLDLAEHDIGAYPDFQQTMIKSYHLREA
ncbi:MAG: ammonium transporter [Bacillota bacterium]